MTTHPNTSSSRCHETTFSLIDSPFFNRSTAAPLMSIPRIANPNIPSGWTASGLKILGMALVKIKIDPPNKIKLFKSAPNMEKRAYPKENL